MSLAKDSSETIYLRGNASDWNIKEYVAAVACSPGHIVEFDENLELVFSPTLYATGTLTFSAVPSDGDSVTIGGKTIHFVSSLNEFGPDLQISVSGLSTATDIATTFTEFIGAGEGLAIQYRKYDTLAVSASRSGAVVTLTADAAGDEGNDIDTTSTTSAATFSGSTLTGGTGSTDQPVRVVLENQDNGIAIDGAYDVGDIVRTIVCQPGDEVLLRVAAGAEAITQGGVLSLEVSDGTVKNYGTNAIATALETVDNSSGSDTTLIKAEVF